MTHSDHVELIRDGMTTPGGVWADLGSGEGAFTLALADLGKEHISIFSIDKTIHSLIIQEELFKRKFPETRVEFIDQDFTQPLTLPSLDGILMANSLHFVQQKHQLLQQLKSYLKPGGAFILVEYNVDRGNIWVPYPLSFKTWQTLAPTAGFTPPKLLHSINSDFLNEIYSSVCYNREI